MNELNKKIKQGYDNAELPEELRLRVREELLAAAETKKEGGITMSKRIKKPAAIAVIAAAVLTAGITAGAVASGKFHKESIDTQLGEGTADVVTSTVKFGSYWVENEYMRITADAVFCDGNSVTIFLTTERLTDPALGWGYLDGEHFSDGIGFETCYEDGTFAGTSASCYSPYLEPTEDGVQYERYTINNIEPGRPIVLSAYDSSELSPIWNTMSDEEREELISREDYDEYREKMRHPASVQGLSLTIDTTPNFTPVTFADEEGREIFLSPYCLYSCASFEDKNILDVFHTITLVNSETGERRAIDISQGGPYQPDENGVTYTNFSFGDYITDMEQYDTIELENVQYEGSGSFHRQ